MPKFLAVLLTFFLVVILGILVSVRFFPQLYVSAYNEFSSETVSINDLEVRIFPLSISADKLGMTSDTGKRLVSVEKLSLSAQIIGWLKGEHNFWSADLSNVDVQLNHFPDDSSDSTEQDSKLEKFNIHQILSGLKLKAQSIRVQLDENSYLSVNRFNTDLNNDGLSDYTLIEQDIDFSFDYVEIDTVEKKLSIDGVLQSRFKGGVSKLSVVIPTLDLSPLLESEDADQTLDSAEAPLEWQWLASLEPFELDLTVDEVILATSSVRKMNLALMVNESLKFTQKALVAWNESDGLSFEDSIEISGEWSPINDISLGADLRGQATVTTPDVTVSIDGDLNVNGVAGNSLSIAIDSERYPFKDAEKILEQFFPMKVELDVTQTESVVDLTIHNAKLGKSDVRGAVSINSLPQASNNLNAKLESNFVSFMSAVDTQQEVDEKRELTPIPELVDGQENDLAIQSQNDQSVFTDDIIEWPLLNELSVAFDWQAKAVTYDDIEVSELHLPIELSNGELSINGATGNLAGGSFEAQSNLVTQGDTGVLKLSLSATDVVLEELHLLPPEELSEAATNLSVELESKGSSTKALASSLNGFVKINVGNGLIGNDSFELIGSDLILGLLNKLNPFSKGDKTTELECAVVNLKINNGKVNIDKSLALRTSKLTMVADGYVDLGLEKIKLSLTPKARSGIGVDVSSLVKFIAIGGSLSNPSPTATASGLLESAVVVGAAISTGGISLLATSAAEKTIANVDVCKRADNAFN